MILRSGPLRDACPRLVVVVVERGMGEKVQHNFICTTPNRPPKWLASRSDDDDAVEIIEKILFDVIIASLAM